jgi:hypothetical protein
MEPSRPEREMTTSPPEPPAERDVDLMLRQLRAAHWGGSAGQVHHGRPAVLHPRLRRYAASRTLFGIQEHLVGLAERMIGDAPGRRRITWTDVQAWAWCYGLRRPPLQFGSELGKLYASRSGQRTLRRRVETVNVALIPYITDSTRREPVAEPAALVHRDPDDGFGHVKSFKAAVLRARGEAAHCGGHDPEQAREWDLVLCRLIEQRWDTRTLRQEMDGVLSAGEREAAARHLALNPMQQGRVRNQMRILVGFHQQDVEAPDPARRPVCGVRWSFPPSEAHDPRERPRVGSSGDALQTLEAAVDRIAPYMEHGADAEDVVRALHDGKGDLPGYAALAARAIENYGSRARLPLDIPAYDVALAVDQALLRHGFPDPGTPAGRALARIDVAKLSVLLESADPRALEYGQRALHLEEPGVDSGDRDSVTLSMRAMRHMASVLRKSRNGKAAGGVHAGMSLLLESRVLPVAADEQDRIRQRAIHFIHVSCILPLEHRRLITDGPGAAAPLSGDAVEKVWEQVEKGRRLLHELNTTDESFRRAAGVTRASLMRRIVELSALPIAGHAAQFRAFGADVIHARTDAAREMLDLVRDEARADSPLTRLLAIRCGMHLAIASRDHDLAVSLAAEAEPLRQHVPANAVIHHQLDELRRAATEKGLAGVRRR